MSCSLPHIQTYNNLSSTAITMQDTLLSGKDLQESMYSYDIQDKANQWHTVGRLHRRNKYNYQFDTSPFTMNATFLPLMDWHYVFIFRRTPGVPAYEVLPSLMHKNYEMDDNNRAVVQKMNTALTSENPNDAMKDAVKTMFTHPQSGKPMTYAQMRHLYG